MGDDIWSAVQLVKEAVEWIVTDLTDAGVQFEHLENIKYFLSEADKEIEGNI